METHLCSCLSTPYAHCYTERQCAILNDDIPLEQISLDELDTLMRKARWHGDTDSYEIAAGFREAKKHPTAYVPPYTGNEAMEVLQSLTPWKIN